MEKIEADTMISDVAKSHNVPLHELLLTLPTSKHDSKVAYFYEFLKFWKTPNNLNPKFHF